MMVTGPVWNSLQASGARVHLLVGQNLVQVRPYTGPL